ncbi:MAG: NADP-dependent malic enzyme [Halobacteriovoraceae bacterium]|nr:NADP-dependent malic enzyme [Halobacteriovoraceae bacterium]
MKDSKDNNDLALKYHSSGRPGKIEVQSTKPTLTANDLSLAYSPGVASPCLEIAKNPEDAYKYTTKGNLVGVVSNGSAVLGLGNIGALAGKPVMEGKGVLFKRFADIDVFDIEVDEPSIEGMVRIVKSLEPTFGGINLEDIKAPECFEIEKQLIELMDIPVFHDDQHGTAIIAAAGFINALEVIGKKASEVKVVFSGAGAASMATANLFMELGVRKENLVMTDSKGVIYEGRRDGMNPYKEKYAIRTEARTLEDAMKNADAFIGCSARGVLSKEMVKTMAKDPIIFAMANPEPEIYPYEVEEVRSDAIMATGRSDFPNQVNNVLGFPFIFRGALDVRARKINPEMKIAAVRALASLAKEEVPEEVKMAYGNKEFSFGRNYLIPKPFDRRVLTSVAPAVAKAAIESGVARIEIKDFWEYTKNLEERLSSSAEFTKNLRDKLSAKVKKLGRPVNMLFAEGSNTRILQTANLLSQENRINPVLLGDKETIHKKMDDLGLSNLKELEIITPEKHPKFNEFSELFYRERQRKGVSYNYARELMGQENYFGPMLVKHGMADTMLSGPTQTFPECFVPILRSIGTVGDVKSAGIYILVFRNRILFLADCTVQPDPSSEDLADIAASTAQLYRKIMNKKPKIAFLSYSNFGSSDNSGPQKVRQAVEITKNKFPELIVDGELQADVAVNSALLDKLFPFNELKGPADILIFPDLDAANISYKLIQQLSDASAIGPLLTPLNKNINIIQRTANVNEIVNMSILTSVLTLEDMER